jgi:putative transposase
LPPVASINNKRDFEILFYIIRKKGGVAMSRGRRLLIENACYHIFSRGNQKQRTFNKHDDYATFLRILKKYKRKFNFNLYGYCLMPNHIHLIGEFGNIKNISKFMHALIMTYTIYFNRRYKKVGHLWQDRFKSKIILKDEYLVDCLNYVETNPVRAKIIERPIEYQWSSYKERVLKHGIQNSLLSNIVL